MLVFRGVECLWRGTCFIRIFHVFHFSGLVTPYYTFSSDTDSTYTGWKRGMKPCLIES